MAEGYVSRIDLKEVAFVNSQQHVSIEHFPDGAVPKAASMQLSLFIWSGAKASVPGTATVVLNQQATEIVAGFDNTYCLFKIDEFIAAEMIPFPVNINYNENDARWFKVEVIADTSAMTYDSGTKLATLGWGEYNEGANPGYASAADMSGQIFNLSSQMNITSNVESRLSMYVGESSTNEQIALTSVANGEGTTDLIGRRFNGVNTFMDLGIVPMLNTDDSYIKLWFKGTNWQNTNPFGYNGASDQKCFVFRDSGIDDKYTLQTSTTTTQPATWPNVDDYQLTEMVAQVGPTMLFKVDGNTLITPSYTRFAYSDIGFYLGARNTGGTADTFAETIFVQCEFYNGVETKIFNEGNDWNGAINHGGTRVFSPDAGVTWNDYPTEMIDLVTGSTQSNRQFFVTDTPLIQPTNCINDGWTLVYDSGDRIDYPYTLIDIKDQGHEIVFFGKDGVQMSIWLFGRLKNSTSYARETYSNVNINRVTIYDPSEHTTKTIRTQNRDAFSLHTGILKAEQLDKLNQLLEAEMVWVEDGNANFIPLVVDTKQIEWKDERYSEIHNYSIRFKYANPNINKVG